SPHGTAEPAHARHAPRTIEVPEPIDLRPILLAADELECDGAGLVWREALLGERHQLAVDAGAKDVSGLDVKVGGSSLDGRLDDLFHVRSLRRARATAIRNPAGSPSSLVLRASCRPRGAAPWRRRHPGSGPRGPVPPAGRGHGPGSARAWRSCCRRAHACNPGTPTARHDSSRPPARPSRAARSTCADGTGYRSPAFPDPSWSPV